MKFGAAWFYFEGLSGLGGGYLFACVHETGCVVKQTSNVLFFPLEHILVSVGLQTPLCVCVSGETGAVQVTMALDVENKQPDSSEADGHRDI